MKSGANSETETTVFMRFLSVCRNLVVSVKSISPHITSHFPILISGKLISLSLSRYLHSSSDILDLEDFAICRSFFCINEGPTAFWAFFFGVVTLAMFRKEKCNQHLVKVTVVTLKCYEVHRHARLQFISKPKGSKRAPGNLNYSKLF